MSATRPRFGLGFWVSAAVALAATWLARHGLDDLGPNDWQGWKVVMPAVAAGAWIAVVAWEYRRWTLAAVCLTGTAILTPWGFLYPGPLAAITLAVVAATRAVRR